MPFGIIFYRINFLFSASNQELKEKILSDSKFQDLAIFWSINSKSRALNQLLFFRKEIGLHLRENDQISIFVIVLLTHYHLDSHFASSDPKTCSTRPTFNWVDHKQKTSVHQWPKIIESSEIFKDLTDQNTARSKS